MRRSLLNKIVRVIKEARLFALIIFTAAVASLFSGDNVIWDIFDATRAVPVSEEQKAKVHEYINNNYVEIDLGDGDFTELSILDEEIDNNDVYFTGESHGVNANEALNMKFLRYFKDKSDFKYYLCEIPYSMAYFLNKYMETGDAQILEDIYRPLPGTFAWNKDSYRHWKLLAELNKNLPEDRKIQVIGIDIEHQNSNALRYLHSVLPQKEAPVEISKIIDELKSIFKGEKIVDESDIHGFSKKLKKDMEAFEGLFKQYLGENYFGFKLVCNNLVYKFEAYSSGNNFNKVRDERIFENFKEVNSILPKGKYYGQWGLNHIFQKEQMNIKWVAGAMNEMPQLSGKILSIAYVYDKCKSMNKARGSYSIENFSSYSSRLDIAQNVPGDYLLFKLSGKNSPFAEELLWPLNEEIPKSGVTTDYFQYLVLIRNSGAAEPLNGEY